MSVTPVDNPSLKWKGPVDSTAQTPPPIEYDVDDPTFCSPKSVLSGLASGFCERWAVTHPEFIVAYNGGNSTTLNWNDTNSSAAYRTSIVSNFVENIIVHDAAKMTMASAFYENNGDFLAPEHPTANSSANYMTFMDGMITQLIESGGYATSNQGTPLYGTFGELAASGSRNASANGSLCSLPISNASAYTSQFLPAYPADWAKERKWMLEQLRYLQTTAPITPNNLGSNTEWDYFLTAASSTVTPGVNWGTGYYNTVFHNVLNDTLLTSAAGGGFGAETLFADPAGMTFERRSDDWKIRDIQFPGYAGEIVTSYNNGATRPADCPAVGATGYVNIYMGSPDGGRHPGGAGDNYAPWFDESVAYQVSAVQTITMAVKNETYGFSSGTGFYPISQFVVQSGGTLTLTATAEAAVVRNIAFVTVSSGGRLILSTSAYLDSCCVMSGGSLVYRPSYTAGSSYIGNVGVLFLDYKRTTDRRGESENGAGVHEINQEYKYATGNTTLIAGSSYLISTTAVKAITADCGRVDVMGGTCTIGATGHVQNLVISSGGTAIISSGMRYWSVDYATVLPGGVLSCVGSGKVSELYIMSGGSLYAGSLSGVRPYIEYAYIVEGATVSVNDFQVVDHHYEYDGSPLFYELSLYSYHNYGARTDEGDLYAPGWNTALYKVCDIQDGNKILVMKRVLGYVSLNGTAIDTAETTTEEKKLVSSSVLTVPNIGLAAGVTPDVFEPKLIALAVNGGTATKTQVTGEDYYPSFKLRQNET